MAAVRSYKQKSGMTIFYCKFYRRFQGKVYTFGIGLKTHEEAWNFADTFEKEFALDPVTFIQRMKDKKPLESMLTVGERMAQLEKKMDDFIATYSHGKHG